MDVFHIFSQKRDCLCRDKLKQLKNKTKQVVLLILNFKNINLKKIQIKTSRDGNCNV